jgi:hypothetical protein
MFGNRSDVGEIAVARLLTVTRTCQMQHLNTLAYLTAAPVPPSSSSHRLAVSKTAIAP